MILRDTMTNRRRITPPGPCGLRLFLALLLSLTALAPAQAESKPAALDKPVPQNVKDLRAIQEQVRKVLDKAIPCTVGIRIGNIAGSGVIISKDGYVLTAGHISGEPDRKVILFLADGRKVQAKTLGSDEDIDSGLIQITEKGDWPFAEMGDASKLKQGQWCIGLGHPGSFKAGRTPVVRLGRVLGHSTRKIQTSCALVGGDSGGPLFDMDGKVIGIHSRIGERLTFNLHVPVDVYRNNWDKLVKSEVLSAEPYIGVSLQDEEDECKITDVKKGSPADEADLKAGDVVLRFNKRKFTDVDELIALIHRRRPGDWVSLEVRRGDEVLTLDVKLGRKRGS
jgi:serine protease Do